MLDRVRKALGLPYFPPWAESEYLDASRFTTPREMLEFNIYWEVKAIEGYTLHRSRAVAIGDLQTARLFSHILIEETEHLEELITRLKEIT